MPSSRKRTAVLASGGGTNLQALIDAASDMDFPAEITLVLTNVDGAFCLERARRAGIEGLVIDHRQFESREAFEAAMDRELRDRNIELICLAGFMRVLQDRFVNDWHDRMLNIHPSLLPKYKGLHTHARALAAGDSLHGCTVHLVRAALDDGPMILQAQVPVLAGDDEDTLQKRVLVREHEIYPRALALLAEGRVDVRGPDAWIDGTKGPLVLLPELGEARL
ncbi:MAG: phosphoribosylglycinamide formyltransferase [Alphaproteobacteria bacterium]